MKRFICLFVAIVMMLSSIPAFADTSKDTMSVGDVISIGHYEQDGNKQNGTEPIEWMVLAVEDTKALIISTKGLEAISYSDPMNVESFMDQSLSWETSYLRAWLNKDFLKSAFNTEELYSILATEITHNDASGLSKTEDRVFCLSITEAEKYFPDSASMACKITNVAKGKLQLDQGAISDDGYGNWWLRDMTTAAKPQKQSNFMTGTSNTAGYISEKLGVKAAKSGKGAPVFCDYLITVRPAMWINLSETTDSNGASGGELNSNVASIFDAEVLIATFNEVVNKETAKFGAVDKDLGATLKTIFRLSHNNSTSNDLKTTYKNYDGSMQVNFHRDSKDALAYKIEIIMGKNSVIPDLSSYPAVMMCVALINLDNQLESNNQFTEITAELGKISAFSMDEDDLFFFSSHDSVIGILSGDGNGHAYIILERTGADARP